MRRIALISALILLSATPSVAQNFEGNWGCRDTALTKTGILTIYGQVYGFASATVGDKSSGTGTITAYQDGVGFNDGGLQTARAIRNGRMVADAAFGIAIQLETADAIVMHCTPH